MTALALAATRLAKRGMWVFQLAPGSKKPPRGSHGHLDASNDPAVVAEWWRRTPHANVGIATGKASGIWVLDVDLQHDGPATLAALLTKHRSLPPTVEAATPSGGRHLWWRWPADGTELRNSVGCIGRGLGRGLDVRGKNGSIIIPPSVLRDGRRYCWTGNARQIAAAPPWLIALALPPPDPVRPVPALRAPSEGAPRRYVRAAIAAELRTLEGAAPGCRNGTLNRAAFAVAGFAKAGLIPEGWAVEQLTARALAIGLTPPETAATIASAFRAARPRELPR